MVATALALAVLALGACGGDDDEPAVATGCGQVAFTPNSDDGAFEISAEGVACDTARTVAGASRDARVREGTARFSAEGFECAGRPTDAELPGTVYRCTRDDAIVTFTRN